MAKEEMETLSIPKHEQVGYTIQYTGGDSIVYEVIYRPFWRKVLRLAQLFHSWANKHAGRTAYYRRM